MDKKLIVPATLTLAGALMLSGCGTDDATREEMKTKNDRVKSVTETDIEMEKEMNDVVICDENGNRYATVEEAAATGLDSAQYGATYCQYFDENGNEIAEEDTTTTVKTNQKYTETMKAPREATSLKTVPPTVSTENFSKKEQLTGSKKHNDFILEHVKHNDAGDKYAIAFKFDREHDAKTHAAPYTVATYHAHDSKNNNGRIEVEIHEIDKNKFDVSKIVKPKHNKYVKDIVMEETDNATRAKFIIHLEDNATGKFNLSSNVANNQDATITLDILE